MDVSDLLLAHLEEYGIDVKTDIPPLKTPTYQHLIDVCLIIGIDVEDLWNYITEEAGKPIQSLEQFYWIKPGKQTQAFLKQVIDLNKAKYTLWYTTMCLYPAEKREAIINLIANFFLFKAYSIRWERRMRLQKRLELTNRVKETIGEIEEELESIHQKRQPLTNEKPSS